MKDIYETVIFWVATSFFMATITLYMEPGLARGIMMLNTMLASANVGAKVVRRELGKG